MMRKPLPIGLKNYEKMKESSASIYLGPVKLRISQDTNLDFQ